jgi:phage terminase large subunit GpA-like protein
MARRIWAIEGLAGEGKAIWPRRPSKKNVGRVNLYLVGVDSAKDLLFARLKLKPPGPGSFHFNSNCDAEFFAQLTSERVITRYSRGFPRRSWVKTRARNEVLDTFVYAIAAFSGLLAMGLDLERETRLLEERVTAMKVGAPAPVVYQRRVRSRGIEF